MEIRYSNNFYDIFSAKLRAAYYSPVNLIVWLGLYIWITYRTLFLSPTDHSIIDKIIAAIILAALWLGTVAIINVIIIWLSVIFLVKRSSKGAVFTEHIIEFDNTKIKVTTQFKNSEYDWRSIHSVKQDKNYVYLLVSPEQGYVIPKRNLGSNQGEKVFQSMISTLAKAKA